MIKKDSCDKEVGPVLQQLQTTTTTTVDDNTWQHKCLVGDLGANTTKTTTSSRAITTSTRDDSFSELEAILAKIKTPDKESLDAIKQATERQTLDDKVEDAPARTLNLHAKQFGYGNEAESYTLTVPGYKGGKDGYTVNYVSQAVEANESMTKAQYETELDGRDYYEAALNVAERVVEEQSGGRKQTVFDLSLEEREKKELFKLFHPQEWFMMCENATLYKLCRLMM